MPKQLVFWRTDKNDDYVHTNQHCPEIENAKTVQCGTIEQAQHTGHVRACPKCYEKGATCERLQPTAKSQPPKPAETKDDANKYLGTAVAVLALLCCFVWWWNSTPHSSSDDTTATAAVSEYSTETRTTATLRPTARPTATPKPTTKKTSGTFKVTASATMVYNNHVGNDWWYYFEAGDKQLPATVNCSVGDDVSLYAEITEDDSVPDTGWWDGYVTIEDGDFETGFTVTEDVYVYETSGRSAGNEAKFEVTWDFEPQ